jgi:hypothetical protein
MLRLPRQLGPFIYGMVPAAMTTAVATAVAIHQLADFGVPFFRQWFSAWCIASFTMLSIVIFAGPVIQRFVWALTGASGSRH